MRIHRIFLFFLIIFISSGCSDDDDNNNSNKTNGTPPIRPQGYSVSGEITVISNTVSDSDVNDTNALNIDNSSINTAQLIPNPIIVGGYVNRPNTGPRGASFSEGDVNDFFAVDLSEGQQVNLFVANEDLIGNDLDLALLDQNGVIWNASVGEGATESLSVPLDGRYFIQVHAHAGASNYVMNISQETSEQSVQSREKWQLDQDFVIGDVLVQLDAQPEKKIQSTLSTLTSLGLQTQSFDADRRMRFTFDAKGEMKTLGFTRPDGCEHGFSQHHFADSELKAKFTTLMKLKCLNQRADVAKASPNYILKSQLIPDDPFYNYQWNYTIMNLSQAWNVTTGKESVIVAVVDTGILSNHPDIQNKLVDGFDFTREEISLDGDGFDNNPEDPGDQSPGGSTFHGTHVAGVVAAATNNRRGVAGIGWLTKVMPLRVLGHNGNGDDYGIEQAIRYAAGLPNDANAYPDEPADIINLSLGGPAITPGFENVINMARSRGIMIVAAAGNEGNRTPYYPASLQGVVSVAAVDIQEERATYSNYNGYVDITAPGGDNTPDVNGDGVPDGIISTIGDDSSGRIRYEYYSLVGTSMATPHVAGVMSLMKAANPNLTPQQFDNLLSNGLITKDLGPMGHDSEYGYGLLDAYKAVRAAVEVGNGTVTQPNPLFVVTPQSLNFGLTSTNATLAVSNGGGGTLTVERIGHDAGDFLTIQPRSSGEYLVTLNRGGLATGTYTATITIITSANTVRIPVIWQVGNRQTMSENSAGHHYILLVDPKSSETIAQTQAEATDGVYSFDFNGISAGVYQIFAGTDANNDLRICSLGEACGAYLTLTRPNSIEVKGHISGIEFDTGFNVNFSSKALQTKSMPGSTDNDEQLADIVRQVQGSQK